jgi:hypothetical protein
MCGGVRAHYARMRFVRARHRNANRRNDRSTTSIVECDYSRDHSIADGRAHFLFAAKRRHRRDSGGAKRGYAAAICSIWKDNCTQGDGTSLRNDTLRERVARQDFPRSRSALRGLDTPCAFAKKGNYRSEPPVTNGRRNRKYAAAVLEPVGEGVIGESPSGMPMTRGASLGMDKSKLVAVAAFFTR